VQLLRAKLRMDLGRHDAALEALDQFTAKFPICAEAWFGRSKVLFSLARCDNALNELKRHDEALAAYDKALSS
jgi:tetratricopeptide (TPR) repeat protein